MKESARRRSAAFHAASGSDFRLVKPGAPVIEQNPAPSPALYVHVPFCAQKCNYCAFYSHTVDPGVRERYVDGLLRELELLDLRQTPSTIFFGGGTPTLLSLEQWERILQAFHDRKLAPSSEWTVECNPATLSPEKAKLLRAGGVNRVSMGVQSMEPELLEQLGRVHSREMVLRSFETLREAGFDQINLDLMFAIPGQAMEQWRSTLRHILALGSEHLSCYEVIYEEDTPLFARLQAGEFSVDEDLACAMYEELVEQVEAAGFFQYEVANFARNQGDARNEIPSSACRHNVNYWRGGEYFGLGPSAAEVIGGTRRQNCSNTIRYCEALERGERPTDWSETLGALGRAGEIAAFGLRMNAGWPLDLFRARTGFDLAEEWSLEIQELIEQGRAKLENDRFRLTREGLRFADHAAQLFLRPDPRAERQLGNQELMKADQGIHPDFLGSRLNSVQAVDSGQSRVT